MARKQYMVIGLGRFGSALARTLDSLGADVIAIDQDQDLVDEANDYASLPMRLDATNKKAFDEVPTDNLDAAIVCVANEQASIMISLLCVEMGIPKVISKAQTDLQAEVLRKIGVSECVFPERASGISLAHKMMTENIMQSIELSRDYGMAELLAADEWNGKTLVDLGFRREYGLNIIAIRHADGTVNVNPMPTDAIVDDDLVLVIGSVENIKRVEKTLRTRGGLPLSS